MTEPLLSDELAVEPQPLGEERALLGWRGYSIAVLCSRVSIVAGAVKTTGQVPLTVERFSIVDVDTGRLVGGNFDSLSAAVADARHLNTKLRELSGDPNHPFSKLMFFHRFKRDSIRDVVEVLRYGPYPSPASFSNARELERILGIETECSYAYLGQLPDAFGDNVIALSAGEIKEIGGVFSPFDSGGLVNKIYPVSTWDENRKKRYLQQYSWENSSILLGLCKFPSPAVGSIGDYLDKKRPKEQGPHELWGGELIADSWQNPKNDWRAWTWEVRVPGQLPVADRLVMWTCSAELYAEIVEYASRSQTDTEWFTNLFRCYVRGGASKLRLEARTRQEVRT